LATVAVVVTGVLAVPRALVTVSVTVKLPEVVYAWVGLGPVPLAPSPKVQA
jgi:hypothetical protein